MTDEDRHRYRAVLQADDGHTFYGPIYHRSREDAIRPHKSRAYAPQTSRLYRLAYLIKITKTKQGATMINVTGNENDELLVRRIREAVRALNNAIAHAVSEGLNVEVDIVDRSTFSATITLVTVRLTRDVMRWTATC